MDDNNFFWVSITAEADVISVLASERENERHSSSSSPRRRYRPEPIKGTAGKVRILVKIVCSTKSFGHSNIWASESMPDKNCKNCNY